MADQSDNIQLELGGRGARVLRTGIALVHEGELVLPAAGSEAQAAVVLSDDRSVINYYFPVEVEVRAGPPPADAHAIVEKALWRLVDRLENT